MSEPTKIKWRIAGEEFASCNCDWGCPCQFNALPTTGRCEAFVTCLITGGFFGNTRLDDVVFSRIYRWPRAIHEGNGLRHMIIDEQATKGATRRACSDVTTDRVTHLGFFEFKAVGQHDASPVFLAGHPVLDRLNIGLANTGDSNG